MQLRGYSHVELTIAEQRTQTNSDETSDMFKPTSNSIFMVQEWTHGILHASVANTHEVW